MMKPILDADEKVGSKPVLRFEMIALIVQFLLIVITMAGSYAVTQARLTSLEKMLDEHIKMHNQYLRVETWETRNRFIDQKLDRIEAKVDQLLETRVR